MKTPRTPFLGLPVDIIVIYNLIFIYEYNSTRQFHYLLSC